MKVRPLPDEVRERIARAAAEHRITLKTLTRLIGRGNGYISRFMRQRVPYRLADEDQGRIARFLGLDEETLLKAAPQRRRAKG